jgi:hypothetical protein
MDEEPSAETKNSGKLILDATCTPADIHYPTNLRLLNTTRQALEEIIDVLHAPHAGILKKPRSYRRNARKNYLNIDKKKHATAKMIRKGIGQQQEMFKKGKHSIEDRIVSLHMPLEQNLRLVLLKGLVLWRV